MKHAAADQAVREVVERYIDGTYRADVELVRSAFHPSASMNGFLGEELLVGSPEPFFAELGSRPAMSESGAPYQAEILSVDVSGRTATAALRESGYYGAVSFVNHFQLLLVDGEWKIIGKMFETV